MEEPRSLGMVLLGMAFIVFVIGGALWAVFRQARFEGYQEAAVKYEADREQTHREIAAMVGAGTLTTEQAERFIAAMAQADRNDLPGIRENVLSEAAADAPPKDAAPATA